jgi:succinyl-CoA synthetase beta subunit
MNLHEYQAKALFAEFGLPVPEGTVISSLSDVAHISGEGTFAVKAQIHAGGRGKAGGVKIVARPELDAAVSELLGQSLVTYQTTAAGQPVNQVLVEPTASIERELYLGAVIDRSRQRLVVMASTEGGVDIETVAANTPEKILTAVINPLTGVLPYQARELGFGLGLNGEQMKALNTMLSALVTMFQAKDLSLVEINPLVVSDGKLLCLDGKVALDDNALYRQPVIKEWHDKTQEDERELRAHEWDLNYVSLDGQIGCMVNGAGLAMATMDLIKLQGGNPANFLDVGGTATNTSNNNANSILMLLSIFTPPSSPRTTESTANIVTPKIIANWVGMAFSTPNKNDKPLAACCAPNPNDVAKPNKVANTANKSIIWPTQPQTRSPNSG